MKITQEIELEVTSEYRSYTKGNGGKYWWKYKNLNFKDFKRLEFTVKGTCKQQFSNRSLWSQQFTCRRHLFY